MNSSSNSTAPGSQGGGQDSTAQVLASGSQDIAALAGLFVTDGVERNALATEYGYTTVISSALSILGILGLVKSSIKLALGLRQCLSSGWNADSLRGIFGYTLDESERYTGATIDCLCVTVFREQEDLVIEKEWQRFDKDKVPLLNAGWNETTTTDPDSTDTGESTVVDLGNKVRENEFMQSSFVIGLYLVLCSGLTSWILLLVSFSQDHHWHWTVLFGTIGLHISLIIMLAPPLWHAYRTCRPSAYINSQIWDFLTLRQPDLHQVPSKFTFMRTCRQNPSTLAIHQVLHFRGDVSYLSKLWFKTLMFIVSATCTVSYICQYTVLKGADSTAAAVWIAIQSGFALLRVLIWIFDPPFDDPRSTHSEYMTFDASDFPEFSLMRILTDFMGDGSSDFRASSLHPSKRRIKIPIWALRYLQHHDLGQMLHLAKVNTFKSLPWMEPQGQKKASHNQTTPQATVEEKDIINDQEESKPLIYHLETGLTALLRRRAENLENTNLSLEKRGEFEDVAKLNLRLALIRLDAADQQSIQPLLLLHESPTDSPDSSELRRFGGALVGYWTLVPSKSELELLESQRTSKSGDISRKVAGTELVEKSDPTNVFSYLGDQWVPEREVHMNQDQLEWLRRLHGFEFRDLTISATGDTMTCLMDHTKIPLPRTWTLWKEITAKKNAGLEPENVQLAPSTWFYRSQEQHQRPSRRGRPAHFYVLRFDSYHDCMRFTSQYVDYVEEIRKIRRLKLVTKIGNYTRTLIQRFDLDQATRKLSRVPNLMRILLLQAFRAYVKIPDIAVHNASERLRVGTTGFQIQSVEYFKAVE